ncbi:alpha/beta fold hydrolase [Saccharothrix coeruleofusca]|uniref:Alpha/beta hydrolase n=1 Tax=Saccharothrix coeruleofusca TaxID=33919 RepID=A0A918ALJ9_9PSEU|nr:alpha/beta fold hydrolase [Saccharothrix coeruleofusca]GGP53040.1 alpha/beta hydrolase [Saccharothrix coeruleofusca]
MTASRGSRAAAVGACLAIAAGGVAVPAAVAAPSLTQFYQQDVEWAPCDTWPDLQCTQVVVPLDYREPDAERISIAVSKLPAADPARRRGVLLLNPGGPGGSGLSLPLEFATQRIARSYDIIGFDPRGVGASTPLRCELESDPPLLTRPTDAQLELFTSNARAREDACRRAAGGIRPHVNTPNTARDMDVVRAVLGEQKINYLGFSYGTYLGAVYGSLFPGKLDRSVLDSAVHPDWIWREQFRAQSRAIRDNVDEFMTWVGQRHGVYGFGTSREEVLATSEALGAKLAVTPWQSEIDLNTYDIVVGSNARYREIWHELASLMKVIRDDVEGAAPGPELLADATRAARVLRELGIAETMSGVFQTVTCEADWTTDLNTYYSDMREFRAKYPYGWGVLRAAPNECTFRSFTPTERVTDLKRVKYPAGLVVQAEFDPQTHYDGGPAMATRLNEPLISVADEGIHGLYSRNDCVTALVDRYLVDGVLPGSRTVCAGTPRPDVPADEQVGADLRPQAQPSPTLEREIRAFIDEKKLMGHHF